MGCLKIKNTTIFAIKSKRVSYTDFSMINFYFIVSLGKNTSAENYTCQYTHYYPYHID